MNTTPLLPINLPAASRRLFGLCVCGHPQWKHVAFSHDCREAGCHCQFFGEASNAPTLHNSTTPTHNTKKG